MRRIDVGLANLFVQHTSASLTINENADPDVRSDMEVALNKVRWGREEAKEGAPKSVSKSHYAHSYFWYSVSNFCNDRWSRRSGVVMEPFVIPWKEVCKRQKSNGEV